MRACARVRGRVRTHTHTHVCVCVRVRARTRASLSLSLCDSLSLSLARESSRARTSAHAGACVCAHAQGARVWARTAHARRVSWGAPKGGTGAACLLLPDAGRAHAGCGASCTLRSGTGSGTRQPLGFVWHRIGYPRARFAPRLLESSSRTAGQCLRAWASPEWPRPGYLSPFLLSSPLSSLSSSVS